MTIRNSNTQLQLESLEIVDEMLQDDATIEYVQNRIVQLTAQATEIMKDIDPSRNCAMNVQLMNEVRDILSEIGSLQRMLDAQPTPQAPEIVEDSYSKSWGGYRIHHEQRRANAKKRANSEG